MESDLLERSRQYMNEGRYEKAQIILRRALEENPERARILELCGDLAVKMGRTSEAIARYEHACENYLHNNEFPDAIICLEKILNLGEISESVLFKLVELYNFYGLPNEALKRLLDHSSISLAKNNESMFVAILRKITELQPKNLPLRLSFAKLLFSLNRNKEADDELMRLKKSAEEIGDENMLKEINNLMPQTDGGDELDPKSRIELGNLLYEIGSKDEAIVEFSKAASDLLKANRIDEAITVLNRIIEIDPNNGEALNTLKQVKEKMQKEEVVAEPVKGGEERPPKVEEVPLTEVGKTAEYETTQIQSDLDLLKDLSKEIEGFEPLETKVEEAVPEEAEKKEERPPEVLPLEGQIADIEFLLKEAEVIHRPSFDLARQFDEFRSNIVWEKDDTRKKIELAKKAFACELYNIALSLIEEAKEDKEFWPDSVEILGASLIKLGRYSDAIKAIVPIILLEEINERRKLELRYILASAYEGMGDFENALREIEHILGINPGYRDVKEMYELLGGMIVPERAEKIFAPPIEEKIPSPPEEVIEKPVLSEEKEIAPPLPEKIEEKPIVETYPTIIEEPKPSEKPPIVEKTEFEGAGENITFL